MRLALFLLLTSPALAAPPGFVGVVYSHPVDPDRDLDLYALTVGHIWAPFSWLDWVHEGRAFYATGTIIFDDQGRRDSESLGVFGLTKLRPRLAFGDLGYVFLDTGVGMVFSAQPFPVRGTRWNFTQEIGGGVGVGGIWPKRFLEIGVRSAHVSNGKGLDETINPSYDGTVIFLSGVLRP